MAAPVEGQLAGQEEQDEAVIRDASGQSNLTTGRPAGTSTTIEL